MERTSLWVSEINEYIKNLLDGDELLFNVCVRGELSNYKIYPSGHHYFTLKDKESSLRCVMFKGSAMKLRFRPENGMGACVVGRISVYPRDGAYQLYATNILAEGAGDLSLAFEQLKEKLLKEGLFDEKHKKPLPKYPEKIAVITSSAGAAVRDIIRVAKGRFPLTKLIIMPVRVQGVEAPMEIVSAINYANKNKIADLIITGRGGGSLEDLWAFNEEIVARAIFNSQIPVISAVGHEPDVTISDYVADMRAATPSNGAELALPFDEDIKNKLKNLEKRLVNAENKSLENLRKRVDELSSRPVLKNHGAYLDIKRMELDHMLAKLNMRFEGILNRKKQSFIALGSKLDALSPLKVLDRGFAIALNEEGQALKNVDNIKEDQTIKVELSRGSLDCRVLKINKPNYKER